MAGPVFDWPVVFAGGRCCCHLLPSLVLCAVLSNLRASSFRSFVFFAGRTLIGFDWVPGMQSMRPSSMARRGYARIVRRGGGERLAACGTPRWGPSPESIE